MIVMQILIVSLGIIRDDFVKHKTQKALRKYET
jgi:hypothetical protein